MPRVSIDAERIPPEIEAGIQRLQDDLGLARDFPPDVVAQAEQLAKHPPSCPDHIDATAIPFVAIDPPESMDLDQIVHIERDGEGYVVHYAIADVASFIEPGSPLDDETHRRGQTFYAPGAKLPLHPPQLSEAAASLLNDGVARPAYLWTLTLDSRGELQAVTLDKALVRNREKLHYAQVQAMLDDGGASETLVLLAQVGQLRLALERARGGISLNLPDQEIESEGTWNVVYRTLLPVESYNAQISLLTGIAASKIMVEGAVGVLRTLPPAEEWSIHKLRRQAVALGVEWPAHVSYPEFVRGLDPTDPQQLALLVKCTFLFRGAGYLAFDGELPAENVEHAALASTYAHTTAPLRRLIDRYVLETCWCLTHGVEIPRWVRDALPSLPAEMGASGAKANAYERGVINLAEALVMKDRVGEEFNAVLIDVHPSSKMGTYQIAEPAVELRIADADPTLLGHRVRLRLDGVDLTAGDVTMSVIGAAK